MFSDLLNNLFNDDEQIRASAEHLLIQLRNENTDQYIQELINIIGAPTGIEPNSIQPRIQQASVVLLGQIIASSNDIMSEKFTTSFYEELLTLLLTKMNSDNYNLAHSSAILFGELLSILVRNKSNPAAFSQLIGALHSEIESLSNNTENTNALKNLKFLLISTISFINSTDLETDQTIHLFQVLYQLYGTNYLTNEVLQAISAMVEGITDTFNQFSRHISHSNSNTDEYQAFISILFDFFNQLLTKASTNEENKVSCYNFFRLFFKYVSISFFHENISKVLELAISDITTSTNEFVLISSIHFLKTTFRREYKMKNESNIQFTQFYNSSHFDSFLMPLIRVFAMIPQDELNLDSDYVEYQNPHLSAQEMISIFANSYPDRSSEILIPLIICLSSENCNSENPTPTTFLCFDSEFEMNSFIAIETSLFLLCLLTQFSSLLPPDDFIISFIGTTLSSPSVRIRFASVRALNSYLKHIKNEKEGEELNEIRKKTIILIPEIIKHVLDEHPFISCYSMNVISKFSMFPVEYFTEFPTEIIFPLFLKVIEIHNDPGVIGDAFKYLTKIIKHRKIEEVFTLIEPVIQLLGNSNQQDINSDYNENLRDLIVVIVQEVTIAAKPYFEIIYSLLIDHIEPKTLTILSFFVKIFDHDFPQNFQQTFEIIFKFLADTEALATDRPTRNKIVSYCCSSLLIIAKSDLFAENVVKTCSLLLGLLSKDNSNLNLLIGISAICLYHKEILKEIMPTLFQIVSQINIIELAENRINDEYNEIDDNIILDDIVSSCVNILMACYYIEPNDQSVINLIVNTLQSIISLGNEIPTLLIMAFDLILFLDAPLLLELENIAYELIKVANDYVYLSDCVNDLRKAIRKSYDASHLQPNAPFENDFEEEEEG